MKTLFTGLMRKAPTEAETKLMQIPEAAHTSEVDVNRIKNVLAIQSLMLHEVKYGGSGPAEKIGPFVVLQAVQETLAVIPDPSSAADMQSQQAS